MAEHGTYNTEKTYYNANFLVYKNKKLEAVFTECSTLPDAPKTQKYTKEVWDKMTDKEKSNNPLYAAIVLDGEYKISIAGINRNTYQGPFYYVMMEKDNSRTLGCLRWDNDNSKFAKYTCNGIELHSGGTKDGTSWWSTGCLNIKTTISKNAGNVEANYVNMTEFYNYVGNGSGLIKIVRG